MRIQTQRLKKIRYQCMILLCLLITGASLFTLTGRALAESESTDYKKFFEFSDPNNLTGNEVKQFCSEYQIKHIDYWNTDEKERLTAVLAFLVDHNFKEIEKISRGKKMRLLRSHDLLVADRSQNSASTSPPTMRSDLHNVLITDGYFQYATVENQGECRRSFAHELGHVADVQNALSLSPEWLKSELPKLAKYRRLVENQSRSEDKQSEAALAKICDLPTVYGSRNATEDFAENYAQLLCNKKEDLTERHTFLRKILESVFPNQEEAFRCSILAAAAYNQSDLDEALRYINRAIELCPDVATFYTFRVLCRKKLDNADEFRKLKLDDLTKARDILSRNNVPEYNGNVRFIALKFAYIWYQNKEYEKQKTELLNLLKNDPDDSSALADLADCYLCLHDTANALIYADKAVAADELQAGAYRVRAGVKTELKRYGDALKDLTLALYIEPKYEWALFLKSKCLFYLGHYLAARSLLTEILAVNPKSLDATYALCFVDFHLGNYKLAITEADTANEIKKRPRVESLKARCLLKLKKFSEGEALLKSAIAAKFEEVSDTSDAYVWLAEAEVGLEQKAKAVEDLNTALKLKPSSTLAKNLLKKIQ